ncbi:2-hydroxy-3-oxopropionate reductase [Sphingobium sp. SCG-1]|uniref:NAD(P)-dependent oxidoreductase n=1 Tax=Sphingobium sp. SCG-1 TaxID=2072936 RepID=UPI000CD6C600|nr:NAD(P)-dependent oxidoreductase [Sphingobium sp. SCG-1]AUW58797.1 2-hydroxy-3-oxopropionate reductase [Sphingobium sp. SCG-1]
MIGFAGLGDIGMQMAHRLAVVHGKLTVWNRTAKRSECLIHLKGVSIASSPEALFQSCELIGLCLTSDVASGEIARRMFPCALPDGKRRIIVDFSTGSPDAARRLAEEAERHRVDWIDAPVSGGPLSAAEGTLTLFLGGKSDVLETAAPLLKAVSAHRTAIGGAGAGQAMKLCNQMIVANTMLTLAETIAAARQAGINVSLLPSALRGGLADSAPLRLFGPRMAAKEHSPRLGSIALMEKDLALARKMMSRPESWTPMSDLCADLLSRAANPEADLSCLIDIFLKTER